jgi:hypothetical protein
MKRFSSEKEGLVDFPIGEGSSEGGGMSVYLVVEGWDGALCFRQDVRVIRQEPVVGVWPRWEPSKQQVLRRRQKLINRHVQRGGRRRRDVYLKQREFFESLAKDQLETEYHFPGLWGKEDVGRSYETALLLGTTGWAKGEWRCTYEELTEEGQQVFDILEERFEGATLRLLTCIDT